MDALSEDCLSKIKEDPSLLDSLSLKDNLKNTIINGINKSNHNLKGSGKNEYFGRNQERTR